MADGAEVFLNAGDFYFVRDSGASTSQVRMRTLLGSCVSVLLWHPGKRIGGMCHAVLPDASPGSGTLDGNHCAGAFRLFQREIQRNGTAPHDYVAYLAGGARMSLGLRTPQNVSVGERNIDRCRALLRESGIALVGQHVGLSGPRRIGFSPLAGEIEIVHQNRTVAVRLDAIARAAG